MPVSNSTKIRWFFRESRDNVDAPWHWLWCLRLMSHSVCFQANSWSYQGSALPWDWPQGGATLQHTDRRMYSYSGMFCDCHCIRMWLQPLKRVNLYNTLDHWNLPELFFLKQSKVVLVLLRRRIASQTCIHAWWNTSSIFQIRIQPWTRLWLRSKKVKTWCTYPQEGEVGYQGISRRQGRFKCTNICMF